MITKKANLVSALDFYAEQQPNQLACVFFEDDIKEQFTYLKLRQRAQAIAAMLQQYNIKGERVLILLPQSLDYLAAFFGCLYASAIAVTAYPPIRPNHAARIKSIVKNASPKIIISDASTITTIKQDNDFLNAKNLEIIDIGTIEDQYADHYRSIIINNDEIVLLQYSSGSTGDPKGVMVNHHNFIANLHMMQDALQQTKEMIVVSWAPLFHDMGLICLALPPLYLGAKLYLMNPFSFVKKPLRWLKAISKYRGTLSFAPDFAYKLCATSITEAEKNELDLSSWQAAVSAAEPVRKDTIEMFVKAFQPCGFKRQAFCTAYGLAESTVYVSGGLPEGGPIYHSVETKVLQKSLAFSCTPGTPNSQILVGCGKAWGDSVIAIVNPDNLQECNTEEIGEIWVSGSHIAQGYWDKENLSEQIFRARTSNGNGPFLRTGDLGFLNKDKVLFITGRIKDLIIIHGKNHAAHDLEDTVQQAHPELINSTTVACSVDEKNEERLLIVIGIKYHENLNFNEIIKTVKQSVYDIHEVMPFKVLFVNRGTISKTTSGKLQRQKIKDQYLANDLPTLEEQKVTEKIV